MNISNIQIFYIILMLVFFFLYVFKQEEKNILKPNEDKHFKKISKINIFYLTLILLIFSISIIQNNTNVNSRTEVEQVEGYIE